MSEAEKPVPDHIVYAAPNLDAAIDDLEQRLGVRAAYGGEHEGVGTHNALLGLGSRRYLEILAPRSESSAALQAGGLLEGLTTPRLFMWAVACNDIEAVVKGASESGYDPGTVVDMSRLQPSGETLRWKLSIGGSDVAASVVPFCIQWLNDPHPSESAPGGCQASELRAEHPEPDRVRASLKALRVELEVGHGPKAGLVLTLDGPNGPVTLR